MGMTNENDDLSKFDAACFVHGISTKWCTMF